MNERNTAAESGFELHEQLAADTIRLGSLPLCELLLMNDANYPWLVLVPRRNAIRELHRLTNDDQLQCFREQLLVTEILEKQLSADKMNVAALGNMVPQLHLHIIARFEGDAAWPGPVWGANPPQKYAQNPLQDRLKRLQQALAEWLC